ncbi:hypothetical protein NC651_005879 [Populus alba x Populus x berolinensis]|nr:hypothetical protein NC651_005879 [Populus alba x Populus x berolinensis]
MEVDFGMWESFCMGIMHRSPEKKNELDGRKLETEEVYGSSTPVLRGSRKGRVRLVRPLYVVFGADGNGAWDDDDMSIIGFVDFIYYLVGEERVRKGRERGREGWLFLELQIKLHTAHVIASAYTRNISNS